MGLSSFKTSDVILQCCWADDECETIVMRRPTFCSAFDEDDHTIPTPPASSDKVSCHMYLLLQRLNRASMFFLFFGFVWLSLLNMKTSFASFISNAHSASFLNCKISFLVMLMTEALFCCKIYFIQLEEE